LLYCEGNESLNCPLATGSEVNSLMLASGSVRNDSDYAKPIIVLYKMSRGATWLDR